jgi:hypothetical protein
MNNLMTNIDELLNLVLQYEKTYPNAESPINYLIAFRRENLIRIIKEANGREIIFTEGKGEDQVSYKYK